MKTRAGAILVVAVTLAVVAVAESVNFDNAPVGQPPAGWTATKTGSGNAKWTIEKDDTAPSKPNVLKQSGVATYPVCFKDDTNLKDGFVEVKFKSISGREDQAGGVVWRLKDADNYYVARANALEDNVTIYDTVKGRRTERKRANMKVAPNQWHTLRVDFQGAHFTVTFDGKRAIEWDDNTFKDAGRVGVWTKADSVTVFDDFSYSATSTRATAADPTVVFVCEHGAAKSVIATAYFNKIAAERGLRARAMYRGVNPQQDLSVSALKGLRDDGLPAPEQKPSAITQADVDSASVIFAIGCTLPSNATASGKAGTWDDVPENKGYGATRDAIKGHVERLIDDLLKKQRSLISFRAASSQTPLTLVGAIDLPGVEGRIDHLAVDAVAQRLYVAALGNNTVEVLDLKSSRHVKSLPGFREPQGIAVVPDAKVVAVANGQGDGVQFIDVGDYHVTRVVRLGDDSDNVRYDLVARRLFVGFGGGALAAVNPADGKVLGEAKLAGHPESFQLERSGSRVFVNVPTADQIAVIDRAAMNVVAAWPVVGARSNFPMALDEASHRLFVGCRRPAKVLVYDTATGKESSSFDIVGDTDDLFYDAARKRLYVSGGEGYIDVFQEQDAGRFTRVAHTATAAGARTSLFVPEQSRLYLAVPHRGNQKAEIRIYEAR